MAINEFINKIKYLLLTLRKHGRNVFEYNSKVNLLFLFLFLSLGCGSGEETTATFDATVSTQAPPFINRVNPTSGRTGDTVTIFGFGFSSVAASNVVTVGGTATSAATYALVSPATAGEIEQLTFTIPTGAGTGAGNIFVTVFDNTSGTVAFTVNP